MSGTDLWIDWTVRLAKLNARTKFRTKTKHFSTRPPHSYTE